jgi:hypothetical protein
MPENIGQQAPKTETLSSQQKNRLSRRGVVLGLAATSLAAAAGVTMAIKSPESHKKAAVERVIPPKPVETTTTIESTTTTSSTSTTAPNRITVPKPVAKPKTPEAAHGPFRPDQLPAYGEKVSSEREKEMNESQATVWAKGPDGTYFELCQATGVDQNGEKFFAGAVHCFDQGHGEQSLPKSTDSPKAQDITPFTTNFTYTIHSPSDLDGSKPLAKVTGLIEDESGQNSEFMRIKTDVVPQQIHYIHNPSFSGMRPGEQVYYPTYSTSSPSGLVGTYGIYIGPSKNIEELPQGFENVVVPHSQNSVRRGASGGGAMTASGKILFATETVLANNGEDGNNPPTHTAYDANRLRAEVAGKCNIVLNSNWDIVQSGQTTSTAYNQAVAA